MRLLSSEWVVVEAVVVVCKGVVHGEESEREWTEGRFIALGRDSWWVS